MTKPGQYAWVPGTLYVRLTNEGRGRGKCVVSTPYEPRAGTLHHMTYVSVPSHCTLNTTAIKCVCDRRCMYLGGAVWMSAKNSSPVHDEGFACAPGTICVCTRTI